MIVAGWRAATVGFMIFVLLGIALGVAVGLGRFPALSEPAKALAESVTGLGEEFVGVIVRFAGVDSEGRGVVIITTVAIALMPGIVCGVLMGCARGGIVLRRLGALLSFAGAAWILVTQPMPVALAAAGAIVVVGTLFAFVAGGVLSLAGAALASVIATAQIQLFLSDEPSRFTDTAEKLSALVGVVSPDIWGTVLAGASVLLPVVVLWSALRD